MKKIGNFQKSRKMNGLKEKIITLVMVSLLAFSFSINTAEAANDGWVENLGIYKIFDYINKFLESGSKYGKGQFNSPPVAVNDSATTTENNFVDVNVMSNDSDPNGDQLSISSFVQGSNGTVSQFGELLRYTPSLNFNGSDSFSYTIINESNLYSSATVTVTVETPTVPTAPTGLQVAQNGTDMVLTWNKSVGATGYEVKIIEWTNSTQRNGFYGAELSISEVFNNFWADTSLDAFLSSDYNATVTRTTLGDVSTTSIPFTVGYIYDYAVRASNAAGYSDSIFNDQASPFVPSIDNTPPNLTLINPNSEATYNDVNQIDGSLSDGGSGISSVKVQIWEDYNVGSHWDGSAWVQDETWIDATYLSPDFTYDTSAISWNDRTYKYRAQATDNAGNISTTTWRTFYINTLSTPSKPIVTLGSNSLDIRWIAVSGATGYILNRFDVDDGILDNSMALGNVVSYIDTTTNGLLEGTNYKYTVQATNSTGNSSESVFSDTVMFDTQPPNLTLINPNSEATYNDVNQIDGSLSDGGSGISSVKVQIWEDYNVGSHWDGSAWVQDETWIDATYLSPDFTYDTSAISWNDRTYKYRAQATDNAGNISTTTWRTFYINSAPTITEGDSITVYMSEDGFPDPFSLTLNVTDSDNDILTWSIDTQATNGMAAISDDTTGNSTAINYTPNPDYNGTDSFVVEVSDGGNLTDTITVNVTIEAVDEIPAVPASMTLQQTAQDIVFTWEEVVGATSYEIQGRKQGGIYYYINCSTNGCSRPITDVGIAGDILQFKVKAKNAIGSSTYRESSEIQTLVAPTFDAIANGTTITLSWNDVVGATSYDLYTGVFFRQNVSSPYEETGLTEGETYTYKILAKNNTNYSSYSEWQSVITDSSPTITEGASTTVTMSEDSFPTSFSLILNATDSDNDTLTWTIDTQATNGMAAISNTDNTGASKAIKYIPNVNYNGTDNFVVEVSDGNLTDTITVEVTIEAVDEIPTDPESVTAIQNGSDINLTWSGATGATSYSVQGLVNNGSYIDINSCISSNCTISMNEINGSSPGDSFKFQVKAHNEIGSSSYAESSEIQTLVAPTINNISSTGTAISLDWNNVGADSYNVYKYEDTALKNTVTGVTTNTYTETGVTEDIEYTYTVMAEKGSFESSESNGATITALSPPTNPNVIFSDTTATLSWDAYPLASSFEVYKSINSGDYVLATNGTVTTNSYIDSSVTAGIVYAYKIRALKGTNMESLFSNTVSNSTLVTPVITSNFSGNQIDLSWTGVAGATGYEVTSGVTFMGIGINTTYTEPGLPDNTEIVYKVRAINNSSTSAVAEVTVQTLYKPTLNIVKGFRENSLDWNTGTYANTFDLMYKTGTNAFSSVYAGSAPSYTHTGLTGQEYTYKVVAVNSNGDNGVYSDEVSATPDDFSGVKGLIYYDYDGNDTYSAAVGDKYVDGAIVSLYDGSDDTLISSINSTANGYYEFDNLTAGSYKIEIDPTSLDANDTPITTVENNLYTKKPKDLTTFTFNGDVIEKNIGLFSINIDRQGVWPNIMIEGSDLGILLDSMNNPTAYPYSNLDYSVDGVINGMDLGILLDFLQFPNW